MTPARIESWKRYDNLRKDDPLRIMKERARYLVRKANFQKFGWCGMCGKIKDTVLHHPDYNQPLMVIEVCKKCHRELHPRKMPNGVIR